MGMRHRKTTHTNSSGLACELSRTYSTIVPFFIHGEIKQNSATSVETPKNGRTFLCVSRFHRTASLQNLCERREQWGIRGRNGCVSHRWENLTHRFDLVIIFAFFGYLKYLNRDVFRPISSPPNFCNNRCLAWYLSILRDAGEDVSSRHDPIATTNSAKMGQSSTLQFSVQLLIRVQDLGGVK